jgi:acyl carrier protein
MVKIVRSFNEIAKISNNLPVKKDFSFSQKISEWSFKHILIFSFSIAVIFPLTAIFDDISLDRIINLFEIFWNFCFLFLFCFSILISFKFLDKFLSKKHLLSEEISRVKTHKLQTKDYEILEKINQRIKEQFGFQKDFDFEDELSSLSFDELDLIEFGMDLEEYFGVEITEDEINLCQNFNDLVNLILGKLGFKKTEERLLNKKEEDKKSNIDLNQFFGQIFWFVIFPIIALGLLAWAIYSGGWLAIIAILLIILILK